VSTSVKESSVVAPAPPPTHDPSGMRKQPAASCMPLANVEDADDEVTFSAVVCRPAPNVDVALPRIVVVDVRPTKSPSSIDDCVEDALEMARSDGSESVTLAFSLPEPDTEI